MLNTEPMEKISPPNILLVDDEHRFLAQLAIHLRDCSNNFCILTAENGQKALKVLESAPVNLVVTDLKMPVMDGFELLLHMKEKYPNVPVIVMSAFLYPEVETRLRELGASGSIEKLNIGALEEMIAKRWQKS